MPKNCLQMHKRRWRCKFSAPEKSKSHKAKPLSTSFQELPRRHSLRFAQLTPTTMVEETNPLAHATLSNACTSSQERGVDPHFPAEVGSSATKLAGATTDTRKGQSTTPPTQVIYIMMSVRNHNPTFGLCCS